MLENQSNKQSRDTEIESLDDNLNEYENEMDIPPQVMEVLQESGLSEEEQLELMEAVSVSMSGFSGPLPHPSILAGYEDVVPGAGERILKMAENEAKHRHYVDDRCIKIDARDSLLGILSAVTIGMTCVVGGIVVMIKVPELAGIIAGTLLAGTGLASIVGSFIRGTKTTWKMSGESNGSNGKKDTQK